MQRLNFSRQMSVWNHFSRLMAVNHLIKDLRLLVWNRPKRNIVQLRNCIPRLIKPRLIMVRLNMPTLSLPRLSMLRLNIPMLNVRELNIPTLIMPRHSMLIRRRLIKRRNRSKFVQICRHLMLLTKIWIETHQSVDTTNRLRKLSLSKQTSQILPKMILRQMVLPQGVCCLLRVQTWSIINMQLS